MENAINPITALTSTTAIDTVATNLSLNFVHDGEKWTVDELDPPTLKESYQITEQIIKLKDAAEHIEDQSCWLLGNILLACRDHFGDDYDPSNIMDATAKSYHTLVTSESVFLAFGDRRVEGLSFTHHKEVHYTKGITDEQKFLVLEKAKECDLSTKQTRTLASMVKKQSIDILEDLEPLDIINEIDAHKKVKEPVYICVTFNEVVKSIKESDLTDDAMSKFKIVIQIQPDLEVYKNVTE